ncbi:Dynein assembly factor 5, axonemal [Amphibalanus amphitrite]|uniref:Dynein assembly factor 5, axonemal n=1 Tax=Amphibalanus amphitrite TaxID=1232801 RepID=A0A6A4W472_AMPAM|nr:Dynein assembly factor 5, axonemal [Amphibalanus amphitrite]
MAETKAETLDELSEKLRSQLLLIDGKPSDKLARRRTLEALLKVVEAAPVPTEAGDAPSDSPAPEPALPITEVVQCLSDPSERCRELAVSVLSAWLARLTDRRPLWPPLVAALRQRLAAPQPQPAEPSEEVRLQLVRLAGQLVDSDGAQMAPYLDHLVAILAAALADPSPDLKTAACQATGRLARSLPRHFHLQSASLVPPLLRNLAHQRWRVREPCVRALGDVVQFGDNSTVRDAVSHMAQRMFDQVPQVRLAVTEVAGRWLVELPDRYSFFAKILPLLLTSGGAPSGTERGSGHLSLLTRLLQLSGHASPPGWPWLIYSLVLYLVLTATAALSVLTEVLHGFALRQKGRRPFAVAFETSLFGTPHALMWLSLTATLCCSRRRLWAVLQEARRLLADAAVFPSHGTSARRVRHQETALAAAVLMLAILSLMAFGAEMSLFQACSFSTNRCLYKLPVIFALVMFFITFFVIPIKLTLLGCLLSGGYRTVNAELKSMAGDGRLVDGMALRHLRLYYRRLSRCFADGVGAMNAELSLSMFTGTVCQIMFYLFLMACLNDDKLVPKLPLVGVLLVSTLMTLLPPCLVGQRLLDCTSVTRDLLLELDSREPNVVHEVAQFSGTVRRDLDKTAHLSFYRLELSTVLSITSTILTYVIVLVQFYVTEQGLLDPPGPLPELRNATRQLDG